MFHFSLGEKVRDRQGDAHTLDQMRVFTEVYVDTSRCKVSMALKDADFMFSSEDSCGSLYYRAGVSSPEAQH